MFETTVAKNKYGTYCVPNSSLKTSPPAKKIMAGNVYEPDTIDYIIDNCGKGDIVHAGAYFGDFLPALAKNCNKDAKIWAFEPKKEHYFCSMKTLELNDIHNTLIFHAACGVDFSKQILQTTKDDGVVWGGGSRIVPKEKAGKTETINMVTLDEILPHDREISIIHLDVEGFETDALMGGMEIIKKHLPILILETLPTKSWLESHLFKLRYTIHGTLHRNTILRVI